MIYIDDRDFQLSNTAVTIGKFDGLHKGHMELIAHLLGYRAQGLQTAVMRLDFVARGSGKETMVLRTEEERRQILEKSGVDIYLRYPFGPADFEMSAQDFAKEIIAGRLGAKAVVVGDDFRFGRGRQGTPQLLSQWGSKLGFTVEIVERACVDGVPVSSSLIREYMSGGEIEKARKMLDN